MEDASARSPEVRAAAPVREEEVARRATGMSWTADGAVLEWADGSASPLELGVELDLVAGDGRCCVGIWRRGRRLDCPVAADLAPTVRGGLCPECQVMDKSSSIAADTRMDDPREFAVYLAHHGSAVKVGITSAERGRNRLLEQGALSSVLIATGTLASARRMENLLMNALGLVDRMSSTRKRAARLAPGDPAARASRLLDLTARTRDLPWPPGQQPLEPEVVDHTTQYGLLVEGVRPSAAVKWLEPGSGIAGTIACRIGRDLYLTTERGLVLLDTQLLAGWSLGRASSSRFDAPLEPIELPTPVTQDALF